MSAPLARELRTKYSVCSHPQLLPLPSAQAMLIQSSDLTSRRSRHNAADSEARSCVM